MSDDATLFEAIGRYREAAEAYAAAPEDDDDPIAQAAYKRVHDAKAMLNETVPCSIRGLAAKAAVLGKYGDPPEYGFEAVVLADIAKMVEVAR